MKNKLILPLVLLSLYQPAVFANEQTAAPEQVKGFGIGALVGGIIAGPPGLVIGAAIGSGIGEHEETKNSIESLEKELADNKLEFEKIANEMVRINSEHQQALQNVKLETSYNETKSLSEKVSLSIFFRTASSNIEQQFEQSITNLVALIEEHPEVKVHINAYSDTRGSGHYNFELSQQRAQSVANKIIENGLDANRIIIHAFGETDSSTLNDLDSYVFDRRVDIELTLLNEV